jgi:hypothetical protein
MESGATLAAARSRGGAFAKQNLFTLLEFFTWP